MKFLEFLKVKLFLEAEDGNGDNGVGATPEVQERAESDQTAPSPEQPPQQTEKPWEVRADQYESIKEEAEAFIEEAKNLGYTEAEVKKALENRNRYISTERNKMSAELKAYDENITNFINTATPEEQQVYLRLAENAVGRKILINKIMGGSATPSIKESGITSNSLGAYDHQSFIDAYNEAKDNNDKAQLKRLQQFADNSSDRFYRDFL